MDLGGQPDRIEADTEPAPGQPSLLTIWAWLREAARTAFFRPPRWDGLRTTPGGVFCLLVFGVVLAIGLERAYIPGAADFYPQAFLYGWLWTSALALSCWVALDAGPQQAPDGPTLFALAWLQSALIYALIGLVYIGASRAGWWDAEGPFGARWAAWLPVAWYGFALSLLVARTSRGAPRQRSAALVMLALGFGTNLLNEPPRYWYPPIDREADGPSFTLQPEQLEAQPALFAAQVAALAPERAGLIDIYVLTFSPYADEDVFMRESAVVADLMATRFDAADRTLQLINHRSLLSQRPLATPRNLQHAIEVMAARMNRDEDILFIHVSSHGARNGALSARLWPLEIAELRPEQLKAWLDAAGVKNRIVSVSACYSGSWIKPLAGEHTLVMSAADATHTSYGCGRGSALTYFGRAMYDEQLRQTRSFEQAHAAARTVIEQREQAAGKSDGYSNPQLAIGSGLREHLSRLEAQLAAPAAPAKP